MRSIETSTNASGFQESNPEHLHSLSCRHSATELQQLLCPVIMAPRSDLDKYIYICWLIVWLWLSGKALTAQANCGRLGQGLGPAHQMIYTHGGVLQPRLRNGSPEPL